MLSGKATIAGVIGNPVSHSLSPKLHNFWLRKYAIDGAYIPMHVTTQDLRDAIKILPRLGFAGINVTVPHKELVILLADEVEESAAKIGAANTLFFNKQKGRISATNTDAYGFIHNLKQGFSAWQPRNRNAVVVGAGGAARAICFALLQEGMQEIILVNRTRDRAEKIMQELSMMKIKVADWDRRSEVLENAYVLVNTTTLGMEGFAPLEINLDTLPQSALVTDIVYTPIKTDLLKAAERRGNPIVDGLGMLLHQARPGFATWFGKEPEIDDDLRDYIIKQTQ